VPHLDAELSGQDGIPAPRLDSKIVFFGLADIGRIAINHASVRVEFHSRGQCALDQFVALDRLFVSIPSLDAGKREVAFSRCVPKVFVVAIFHISG